MTSILIGCIHWEIQFYIGNLTNILKQLESNKSKNEKSNNVEYSLIVHVTLFWLSRGGGRIAGGEINGEMRVNIVTFKVFEVKDVYYGEQFQKLISMGHDDVVNPVWYFLMSK